MTGRRSIESHYIPWEDDRHRLAYVYAKEQAARKGFPPGRAPTWLIDQLVKIWLAAHPTPQPTIEVSHE